MMVFHFIFWIFLLILIEKGVFSCLRLRYDAPLSKEAQELDDDVQREADRVINKTGKPDTVQIEKMKKVFKVPTKNCCGSQKLSAVSNLSFGLEQGECFALLGVNGAGKSTTFKSLTAEVVPTKGKIQIAGFDIQKDFEKARQLIGYCPQENLLFDTMTCVEHLRYYAQVKGIPKALRQTII
jgi:ATP-binding cassette subfamily A (ABC1) protein 3